jgi:hypothetical protein
MPRARIIDVPLVVRVAAAAVLLGCGADHRVEAQRCVDRDWTVVPDDRCEGTPPPTTTHGSGGYRWYYGGSGTTIGERAQRGSTVPPSEGVVTRPNSGGGKFIASGGPSARGGFGATSSAHSGGS